jgi:DNA-directed RNA polymerase I subunit RPA43
VADVFFLNAEINWRIKQKSVRQESQARTISIAMPSQTANGSLASEKAQKKSSKNDQSSHGEKKRKRDHGDETQKSKSKKHKSDRKPKSIAKTSISQVPDEISPFHMQTSSLFLPLAPISQKTPLEGLCAEHLSPLILTYYPPFSGVILSYSNPRLSEKALGNDGSSTLLRNIDEYAVSWAWVTAEFMLFKPEKGAWLEGYINLQNEGHLGVVCWNLFNASIERKRLPEDWKWMGVEDEGGAEIEGMGQTYAEHGAGYWADGQGNKVEGNVKFRVREIESSHDKERGFLSIEGTMLDEETEAEMVELEYQKASGRDRAGRRLGGLGALGATSLGVTVEPDLMDIGGIPKKHRTRY